MKKYLSVSVIFAAVLFVFAECKKNDTNAASGVQIFAVKTAPAVTGEIQDYIKLSGEIITKVNVDAYADVSYGRIRQLLVDVGDYVRRNQIIAYVDPSTPGTVYNLSPVVAPISGYITFRNGQIGTTINSATPIYRIGDLTQLRVLTSTPERYVTKIFMNQKAEILLEAFPGKVFVARIAEISPVLDTESRTMDIWLEFTSSIKGFKPGMFGTVKLFTDYKNNVITLPVDTVVTRFNENFVFVVSDEEVEIDNPDYISESKTPGVPAKIMQKKVERRIVEEGIRIDGYVEIVSGLNVDDEVVIEGQTQLDDDSLVRIVNAADSTEQPTDEKDQDGENAGQAL
ncbi:MAG: efflux RND transporter periplasmic adaptor subunit [Spirochaetia bacterium]|nr:efflux RND transporter periplasmic adaptor subunit [Spirochaetia bacterium]